MELEKSKSCGAPAGGTQRTKRFLSIRVPVTAANDTYYYYYEYHNYNFVCVQQTNTTVREKGEDARIGGVPRMSPSHVRVAGMRARARQTGAGKICM